MKHIQIILPLQQRVIMENPFSKAAGSQEPFISHSCVWPGIQILMPSLKNRLGLHCEMAFSARVIKNITVPGRQRGGNCHYLRLDFIHVADWWIASLKYKLHLRTNVCWAQEADSYHQLTKILGRGSKIVPGPFVVPKRWCIYRALFISTFCIFEVFQIKSITWESTASSYLICQFKKCKNL